MFSFRRKPSKRDAQPQIRASPSLPQLNATGIPWPESLLDVDSIRNTPSRSSSRSKGAKTSLQRDDEGPVPFHKPFRGQVNGKGKGGTISSLYMSVPPSAFETKQRVPLSARTTKSQRRTRVAPTFNLMIVGGTGTGKTCLLRLLLETADLSPTATIDQQTSIERFLHGQVKPTHSIQTACVEICESRYDRVLFSVIDTPGLDFQDGHELKLERQLSAIIKYIDSQYADTLNEEAKVIRASKGDQHVHLVIYMIDPSSIMTSLARRALSSLPTKTRSEQTISHKAPGLTPDTSSNDDSDDESREPLTMSPADIRAIRRLSIRSNVLPIIARADSLTNEKLEAIKTTVRKGLHEAELDFGVLAPKMDGVESRGRASARNGNGSGNENSNGHAAADAEEDDLEDEEVYGTEEEKTPVIKLRPARNATRPLARSRSRRRLSIAERDELEPDSPDIESVANVRFSAHIIPKTDLTTLLPFSVITPEDGKGRPREDRFSKINPVTPLTATPHDEDAPTERDLKTPVSAVFSTHSAPFLQTPPDDLKGIFTRNFRWGSIDVLNPDHCDFSALRTTVLNTHLKILKMHTKEVLYEKYRTEKLLARRATQHLGEEEKRRFLEELGL